jgi:allantoate deiminase
MSESAARIVERLERLGRITDEPGVLTRTFLSPAMRQANAQVEAWMLAAGLQVTIDGWGNIIGRLPGAPAEAKTLLLGSHLDTVRNAGRYDGPLGVLLAIGVCEELRRAGITLPFHLDVAGFSDEEGVRFHSTYLGSKALAGLVTKDDLQRTDAAGTTLAQAVGNPCDLPRARYAPGELLGYIEAHIEQGPVLEAGGHALGVVTAIAAQSRCACAFTGRAGHAGTTPMTLRRDALAGAAEFIMLVEKTAQETAGLVATVGEIRAQPNVSNVIVQETELSLDIRHADSSVVAFGITHLEREAAMLAERRGLTFRLKKVQSGDAIVCDPALTAKLARAVKENQAQVPHLASGAGHDGVILSRLTPIAMLFVRCREGLSHHPDEHVEPEDIKLALRALVTFIKDMA